MTAKHFGMTVRGYTRASADCPEVDRYFHGDHRQAFATGLDYLVAVLPNTPGTRRLVDAEMLAALPPHAVVVNVGRGDTIDTSALIEALEQQRLAAAVLDVFEEEPLPREPSAVAYPGVFIPAIPRRRASRPTSSASSRTTIAATRVGRLCDIRWTSSRGY